MSSSNNNTHNVCNKKYYRKCKTDL